MKPHISAPVPPCPICRTRHHQMFPCPPTQQIIILDPATDRIEELTEEDAANIAAQNCERIGREEKPK